MLLPRCRLALDETFLSRPALTLTRSRMELAGGPGGGGGGERQVPGQQPGESLFHPTK